jgi:hypothetical protein
MNKSPAAIVKEHFGDKAKLVAALGPFTNDDLWVPRVNETKGLGRIPNAKLLRLFNVLSTVKEKFGNRFKLVDAICEIEKRTKDDGYKKRLLEYPVPRLYDLYRSTARRAGVAVEPAPTLESRLPSKGDAPPKTKPSRAEAKPEAKAASTGKAHAKSPAKKAASKPAAKGKSAGSKKGKK